MLLFLLVIITLSYCNGVCQVVAQEKPEIVWFWCPKYMDRQDHEKEVLMPICLTCGCKHTNVNLLGNNATMKVTG